MLLLQNILQVTVHRRLLPPRHHSLQVVGQAHQLYLRHPLAVYLFQSSLLHHNIACRSLTLRHRSRLVQHYSLLLLRFTVLRNHLRHHRSLVFLAYSQQELRQQEHNLPPSARSAVLVQVVEVGVYPPLVHILHAQLSVCFHPCQPTVPLRSPYLLVYLQPLRYHIHHWWDLV